MSTPGWFCGDSSTVTDVHKHGLKSKELPAVRVKGVEPPSLTGLIHVLHNVTVFRGSNDRAQESGVAFNLARARLGMSLGNGVNKPTGAEMPKLTDGLGFG